MNWRAINRLSIYLIIGACSFALANIKEAMTQFDIMVFSIGLVLSLANVCRSFMDSSNEKPPLGKPVQRQQEIVEYPALKKPTK